MNKKFNLIIVWTDCDGDEQITENAFTTEEEAEEYWEEIGGTFDDDDPRWYATDYEIEIL
jgi:hypothetical protein